MQQIVLVQTEYAGVLDGPTRGRPGFPFEDRHLSQELTVPEARNRELGVLPGEDRYLDHPRRIT
jgi:hypothetical protein